MTSILWHLNDLRLDDNEALLRAAADGPVVPVYCIDPRQFEHTEYGFPRVGAFRARFLLESLADLRARYRDLGADLVVRLGDPAAEISDVARTVGASSIHYTREVTRDERRIESALRDAIPEVQFRPVWTTTLYHRDDFPLPLDAVPEVFTHFRKALEKNAEVRPPLAPPERLPELRDIDVGIIPTLSDLGFYPPIDDERAVLRFVGGESAAHNRLEAYFWETDSLRHYKETRNGLLGPNYSSKFSPWLANGCLSPRRIYAEVVRYEVERVRNKSTYWMVFELIWRDFFRFHALASGDRLFYRSGFRGIEKEWRHDTAAYDAWRRGETGIPFVDANMREMAATGFMSNRGRQNVASFLAQNLEIDWRWGAAWFESCLLDHDPASNYGNWQYVSGVGHDPRERWFNVLSQAERYDKKGSYTRTWCPELADLPDALLQAPWSDSLGRFGLELGADYPRPILDLEASHRRLRAR